MVLGPEGTPYQGQTVGESGLGLEVPGGGARQGGPELAPRIDYQAHPREQGHEHGAWCRLGASIHRD